MTDRAQFEAMLEALINDDQQAAKEIFHNIVVGKSREIYEELLAEDFQPTDTGNPYGSQTEAAEDDADPVDDADDSEEDDSADDADDSADDAEFDADDSEEDDSEDGDMDMDMGDEEGEDGGAIEDRVMDLEDALEDLKAEFEQLLSGEEGEEHMGGDDMGMEPEMGGDDMDMPAEMGMDDMAGNDEVAELMEYVNKIGAPYAGGNVAGTKEGSAVGSQNGSVTPETNTKSIVAGKNDMGGTTANIVNGQREVSADIGAKSTVKGNGVMGTNVKPNPDAAGNINVPGGKAGKTAFKTQVKGGGLDRQSGFSKEGALAGTGAHGQSSAKNTKSIISTKVR